MTCPCCKAAIKDVASMTGYYLLTLWARRVHRATLHGCKQHWVNSMLDIGRIGARMHDQHN